MGIFIFSFLWIKMNSVSICLLLIGVAAGQEATGTGTEGYVAYDWIEWYMREFCVKYVPEQCLPEYRTYYEDYFIGRLESPCYNCGSTAMKRSFGEENCSSLENTPINIFNLKDGKMLGINSEGNLTVEQASFAIDLIWTYKTSCYGVTLTNQNPDNIEVDINIYYDPTLKTIMNEEGQFALNSRKGFKWVSEIKFLKAEPGTPWLRYQWDPVRKFEGEDYAMTQFARVGSEYTDEDYQDIYDAENYDENY